MSISYHLVVINSLAFNKDYLKLIGFSLTHYKALLATYIRLPSRYDHIYRLRGVINREYGWSSEDVLPRLAQQLVVRLEGQKILPVLLLQEPPEIWLSKVLGHLLADLLPRLVNCTLVKATFDLDCLIHSVQVQRFLHTKNKLSFL